MASFFDKLFDKLFPDKKNFGNAKRKGQAVVSEELKRSDKDKQAYFRWVNEAEYRLLLDRLRVSYLKKKENVAYDLNVHLLDTPYACGVALTYDSSIGKLSFQHLFDYLKDKTANLGYTLSTSNRQFYDRGDYVQTIEKYYLKPPLDADAIQNGELIDQRFGNILIEYHLTDNAPSFIKVVSNVYSDRMYTEALSFEDFAEALFG